MNRISARSLLFIFILCLLGCSDRGPVRIGYVGGITGHLADIGVAGRDGAMLAVERINAAGGIGGRKVELLVKDDGNDPKRAPQAVQELVDAGAVAIIGHMTSAMSLAGAPVADKAGVTLISPTTSSNDLTGKDDMFLRVYPASRETAQQLARHARKKLGIRRIAIVWDSSNKGHTLGWYHNFSEEFRKQGGSTAVVQEFQSSRSMNLSHLADAVAASGADGVFILAGAVDTALICQNLRKEKLSLPIVVSEWSTTDELLTQGGRTVEGIQFFQHFDRENENPAYRWFRNAYETRFHRSPSFPAVFAYETVDFITEALRRGATRETLKQELLRIRSFSGLQCGVTIDEFGDASRQAFLMTVRNGRFVHGK